MLQIRNVLLRRGDRILFDSINITVHPGHRVGVVGRNGAGKTTLFELIEGQLSPEEGDISIPKDWRLAWLKQSTLPSARSAIEYVIDGDRKLRQIEREIRVAERSGDNDHLANLHVEYDDAGGYHASARAGEILHGLGFVGPDFHKPHRAFSGGWQIRLNLAQTLMSPSELLLLDEPTNHLDLDATVWLERWLQRYDGTLLTIAHDRDFLDGTVNEIVHLHDTSATTYIGNYASFELQRNAELAQQASSHRKQEVERARIQRFVDRFRAKASKAKQVQSRLRALDRMPSIALLHSESPYQFSFTNPEKTSNPLVVADDSTIGYGQTPILRSLTLRLYPKDRIGILGINGAGKTTLLRGLAGELSPMNGQIVRGKNASIGYFTQQQLERLEPDATPMAKLSEIEPMSDQNARNYLGGWGFSGDDIHRPVKTFSGGEKARLVLALIATQKPAILLLDEPTNHLDVEMRQALTLALQEYEGALLLVSHDRHLLRHTVDTFWLVAEGTVTHFDDDLDAYAELVKRKSAKRSTPVPNHAQERRRSKADARIRTQSLRQRRDQLDVDMALLQSRIDLLTEQLANPTTYTSESTANIRALSEEHGQLKKNVATLERSWLDIEECLEQSKKP
ncbi:MAG TPA: ATP-binding cassette domain-containing protein [Pseudomonadales bacterium]|jgi:ATP-binding cassette subfamily F protein 3|nr:ATP-binding cassette domain-containing protein [Pseudomonadales bacterium]